MEKKTVLFDTNVLIHNPLSICYFDGVDIIIPLPVLEELDSFKLERNSVGQNARLACKVLESLSSQDLVGNGKKITRSSCAFFRDVNDDFSITLTILPIKQLAQLPGDKDNLSLSKVDNKILNFCLYLKNEGKDIVLVTKDVNLRVKSRTLGIIAQDYDICPIENDDYKGWKEFLIDADELKSLTAENLGNHFLIDDLRVNEYVVARSSANPDKYRTFRFLRPGKIKEVEKGQDFWGFKPRNANQLMALDLLMDDSVQLVYLIGTAGTGKTLLTVLAGLYKVIIDRSYQKLFISRPLISLGSDIGFIPGDLQEKLFHWMHPFFDNLEHVFEMIKRDGDYFHIPNDISSDKPRKSSKSSRHNRYGDDNSGSLDGKVNDNIAMLQSRGILNLEAITHMRGRSLQNRFMFVDEAQNLTAQEIKTIISRAGEGTKVVLSGDPYQIDSHNLDFYNNGLTSSSLKLRGESIVGLVFLDTSERSELARLATLKL